MSISCTVSQIKARHWSKVADFNLPRLFDAPVGVSPLEFPRDLWHQKTELLVLYSDGWHWLRDPVFSCFDRQRLVTNGRTDKQTQGHRYTALA